MRKLDLKETTKISGGGCGRLSRLIDNGHSGQRTWLARLNRYYMNCV